MICGNCVFRWWDDECHGRCDIDTDVVITDDDKSISDEHQCHCNDERLRRLTVQIDEPLAEDDRSCFNCIHKDVCVLFRDMQELIIRYGQSSLFRYDWSTDEKLYWNRRLGELIAMRCQRYGKEQSKEG